MKIRVHGIQVISTKDCRSYIESHGGNVNNYDRDLSIPGTSKIVLFLLNFIIMLVVTLF